MSSPARFDEPLLPALLRPVVYLFAAFAFAMPLSTADTALVVALFTCAGAIIGRWVAGSRLRLPTILLLALAALVLASAGRSALLASDAFAAWLGPSTALRIANSAGLGLCAACVAVALRAAALRRRLFRALEVAFVGMAFAQLVIGHRGGAINRPFELADSIIAQGRDPTIALLLVGAAAAAACVILLLSERSLWRALLHLSLAILLLLVVLGTTRTLGLPQAKLAQSGLGLRPDEKGDKQQQQGGRGGGQGQRGGQPPQNEELNFQDNYDSSGRQIPLAVVLLHDDYSPPTGLYYFRQVAFSQYNGKRLVQATRGDVDKDVAPGFVFDRTKLADVPNELGDRTRLETTVALLADHNRPFALESPIEVAPTNNPDPGRFRRAYRVVSEALNSDYDALLERGVGDPNWNDEQRAHYTGAPPDERYGKLAHEIVEQLPEDMREDKVAEGVMVSLWLSKQGIYSLKSKHSAAADPTADFLFGDKTGYCVHFAHAAVYLMRSLGIPARVGAGYVAEEAARQGGSAILLSGANSHAWPEMYVTGVGWVIVDVSPERALDPPMQPPDPDLQRLLGELARGQKPMAQSEFRPLDPALAMLGKLPRLFLNGLLVFLPLLLALGYSVKLWRWAAPSWAGAAGAPRASYRAQLDRLSEVAISRRFGESREAFAARVAAQSPSFAQLTRGNVAARFGNPDAAATDRRPELRALACASNEELARAVPYRRRLLGLLHPFSWLTSR